MKKEKRENLCQCHLADPQLRQLLDKVDGELADKFREIECLYCGAGKLHRSDYWRKPRSEPKKSENVRRHSFCCNVDGCRKRHTPPSVLFLGRKVYLGLVVTLVSAMRHGLKPKRVAALRNAIGVDIRTLKRWRTWWLTTFTQSQFWKAMRGRFTPPVRERDMPASLARRFDLERRDRLLDLLRFLSPVTTASIPLERLI